MKLFYNTTKTGAFPIILFVLKMRMEKKGKAETKIFFIISSSSQFLEQRDSTKHYLCQFFVLHLLSAELLNAAQPIRRTVVLTHLCTQCPEHVKCHTLGYVALLFELQKVGGGGMILVWGGTVSSCSF